MFLFINFVYDLHSVMSGIDDKLHAIKAIYFYQIIHELRVGFSNRERYGKREFN